MGQITTFAQRADLITTQPATWDTLYLEALEHFQPIVLRDEGIILEIPSAVMLQCVFRHCYTNYDALRLEMSRLREDAEQRIPYPISRKLRTKSFKVRGDSRSVSRKQRRLANSLKRYDRERDRISHEYDQAVKLLRQRANNLYAEWLENSMLQNLPICA